MPYREIEHTEKTFGEREPGHIETLHYPGVDIVVNKNSSKQAWAYRLAELFKDGIPSDWTLVIDDKYAKNSEDDEDEDIDYTPGLKKGMATGELDGVQFLLKPKRSNEDILKGKQGQVIYRDRLKAKDPAGQSFLRAMNSILNEISLAPSVKEIIESEPFQTLAKKIGYSGMKFVEPVMGIVYRETGDKFLVYELIPDAEELYIRLLEKEDFATNDFVDAEIERLFEGSGIIPRELDTGHLLIDNANWLNAIDIEAFQRSPQP